MLDSDQSASTTNVSCPSQPICMALLCVAVDLPAPGAPPIKTVGVVPTFSLTFFKFSGTDKTMFVDRTAEQK